MSIFANSQPPQSIPLKLESANLHCGVAQFSDLAPDSEFHYSLWLDSLLTKPLDLQGLHSSDLFFRTFPTKGFEGQLDFLVMSCHNPFVGAGGFAVWDHIERIMAENKNVRFAIMAGDQIYADEIESKVLNEPDSQKRIEQYVGIYQKFWSHPSYRKIFCKLPAALMWDDHDITDGWGSRMDSIKDGTKDFKPQWLGLFQASRTAFSQFQALRNPTLAKSTGSFDFCFRVGKAAFVVPDLRSNRNYTVPQMCAPGQLEALFEWVSSEKDKIETVFFVSSVVFSHGDPAIDEGIVKYWIYLLNFVNWLKNFPVWKKTATWFLDSVGDLRDDINDSWASKVNSAEARRVLKVLFDLQNPATGKPINVVILSGDIHTPGYCTIYSTLSEHQPRATIPHITATPISYEPFSWIGEAIYRRHTKAINLGDPPDFKAQVSHHFCARNVVVASLRSFGDERQLKVKYYLQDYPEPQIMLFDLIRNSHREDIEWGEQQGKEHTVATAVAQS